MSVFAAVALAPRDPILGLNEQFNADPRTDKVNLGVGVYTDANGKLPLLGSVQAAEARLAAHPAARGYLPIDGFAAYVAAAQTQVFGAQSPALAAKRVASLQALGGTGALKVGADFLHRLNPRATVWISDPSWENHRALFTHAGFNVRTYAYYDAPGQGIAFNALLADLGQAQAGDIVLLHACCHNPTGYDLTGEQWAAVVELIKSRQLLPFMDMAYQGFGQGLDADAQAVRALDAAGLNFLVASSFSKSFSLYGERVGSLHVVAADADEAARVLSQIKVTARTTYSNPPTHGAKVVATVLTDEELRTQWEQELAGMRDRIAQMRTGLRQALEAAGVRQPLDFITRQQGMFSYSGLSAAQMQRLRAEFGVYGVDSGRLCVAALNAGNLPRVAQAIATVLQG
ncbi:MAG: amino acid aminotransferase [Inhella sp.]|jgi:aromatic-amino-acid transaminase|uniref:amino acid aminotransferase n=1 Tax=Inhella sp. TaxID=1921806 RepID=UPI0022BCB2AE|nr:amino acid aminotransferase [Inhella sp.]MCZ8235805.1 aspartate/tyrosine/aromatic aminotransferase [Inhella sp.]